MEVVLSGFTPDGERRFMLPHFEAPVHIFPKRGDREDLVASLDTIVFEPDAERFTMSWRVARPLKKNMHEIAQVLVGQEGRLWWQQREARSPSPFPCHGAEDTGCAELRRRRHERHRSPSTARGWSLRWATAAASLQRRSAPRSPTR
jgi:hypothetical protein